MNNFEIVILALALVFNSWMPYLNAGVVLSGESFARKANYSGIMFLLQFLMAGTGIWIGYKTGGLDERTNMAISLSIMFIFGLKALLEGIRLQDQEKEFDYTDIKVILLSALAEGITPLAIGISIGLLSLNPYLHWLLIGGFLFAGIIIAFLVAVTMGSGSFKLRLGPFGGLLLFAAAIKMTISLTGF
jgi:putative Mn2+ efflux pump MntP